MDSYEYPSCDMTPIWSVICESYKRPVIAAACEIGLFELLENKIMCRDDLINELKINQHVGQVTITLLVALGYLKIVDNKCHLTEISRVYLISSSPYCLKEYFLTPSSDYLNFKASKDLMVTALKSQDNNNGLNNGVFESWLNCKVSLQDAKISTSLLHSYSLQSAIYIANTIDFNKKFEIDSLLDIAGGSGCFSIALTRKQPKLKCTVLEIPYITEIARDYIQNSSSNKIEVIEGNMFDKLPTGYTAHFYSNILHAWSEDEILVLLKNSYDSLPVNGYIFIHELLLNEMCDGPILAAYLSIIICLGTQHGKLHNFSSFKNFLTKAGFNNINIISCHNDYSIIYAQKINN